MSKRVKSTDAEAERDVLSAPGSDLDRLVSRHLCFGWWALLVFLALGIGLELLHGFKIGWYLDVTNAARRHMWTLAHAHGTLLALVHLAFAASVPRLTTRDPRWRHVASPCLYAATLTLPAGFFLGGLYVYSGDPGMGILLVPVGGFLLLIAVGLIALAVTKPAA
jgi:hypothetical protein